VPYPINGNFAAQKNLATVFGLKCLKIGFGNQFWEPRLTHPRSQLASLGSHASVVAMRGRLKQPSAQVEWVVSLL
jgi:hypothetical protein